MNPRSLANLKLPFKKGEVHNPRGINRKRPITDRYYQRTEEPLPDDIRERFNRQMGKEVLKKGATWGDAIALRLCIDAVLTADTGAAREIREAIEGRSPQRLEIFREASTGKLTMLEVPDQQGRYSRRRLLH